jgi:rRNA maturation endonuclease Nob1
VAPQSEPSTTEGFNTFEFWREPLAVIDLDIEVDGALGDEQHSSPPSGSDRFSSVDLPHLEDFLQTRSFVCSYELSAVDRWLALQLAGLATTAEFCNVSRWLRQVSSYSAAGEAATCSPKICAAAVRSCIRAGENFSLEDVLEVNSEKMSSAAVFREAISSDEGVSMDDSDKEHEGADDGDTDECEGEYGEDDGDEDGWITPSNLKEKRAAMAAQVEVEGRVQVACMTTDFAMQNVLRQIGLNIIGTNGMIIRVSCF